MVNRRMRFCITLLVVSLFPQIILQANERLPNVVIIFLDDSGWSDFHPFGQPTYETPHVERLAEEGTRFDRFYVPQAICSASRSALLTGCFPGRTKMFGAHGPNARGLEPKFATIAELLKERGYATAHFGKWHCGDQDETRPLARGFDEHAGLMYSNDMWRYHPTDPEHWGKYPLQFWDNGEVTIEDVGHDDQSQLTTWATENAVDFIRRKRDEPFFLYLAHSMPHVPLYCSDKFLGKSGEGLYGDVIMELDWSVGEVMEALREHGLEENTLVIFSSDNGPWSGYGNHAGNTPFREAKATGFDGGLRSATLIKYPGMIPGGVQSQATLSTVDLLPTIVGLAGAQPPANQIDGKDVWPLIVGKPEAQNPHRYYPFSTGKTFEGIITADGRWKLHLPHAYRFVTEPGVDGAGGVYERREIELSLFDLENDPGEINNLVDEYPEVAYELKLLAEAHRERFYKSE